MQITRIDAFPLGYVREYPSAFVRSFALVKVQTDAGFVGWGEASDCFGHSDPLVIRQIIEEELQRHLVGEDPLLIEQHMRRLHQWLYRTMGLSGAVVQALSGVEIALWDIRGKARGEPIHRMLGSYRDRVAVYGAGTIAFGQPPEWHVRFFDHLLERGCKTIKLRIGNSLRWDVELVKGVRQIVGDDIDIIVDGKFNYTLPSAIKLARRLEEYDVLYLEEPMPQYDLEALAELRASTHLPIAYGEHAYTVHEFRDLITRRAANVLQPDATLVGGLAEARKVSVLAEAWGMPISPHCGGLTAVGVAANVHLSAAAPTFTVLEYDATPGQPLREELLKDGLFSPGRIVDGCLTAPEGPGLGIEVDESVLEKYPYRQRGQTKDLPGYGTPHL
jgi:L-alanine-DL-glutamate epimerase-like enolase superfamily enzyme